MDAKALLEETPLAQTLGIEFVAAEDDRLEAPRTVAPALCNRAGSLHGAALIAIADTLGAIDAFLERPEGAQGATTLRNKTNFLGMARPGDVVTAVCAPIHVGRRTSVWQTTIRNEAGKTWPWSPRRR